MFGLFKKSNKSISIDAFWESARNSEIESVFKEGRYISFLIFPTDLSLFSDKNLISSEGMAIFVKIIEERILKDEFDPVLPDYSVITGIESDDKGKLTARRHVLQKKPDGKTVRRIFDWVPPQK